MRKFKVVKDYYNDNEIIFKKSTITIESGLTVLVGCNGSGKTTLLQEIHHQLKKEKIPVIYFNNLADGGSFAISKAGFYGDMSFMATAICSSEGEQIVMNIGNTATEIGSYIRKHPDSKEIWILLDAIDSGLSIDNVLDMKDFFKFLQEQNPDKEISIVTVANEYELCNGERCFDVTECKYISFKDYEDYKQFIINSRKKKNNRVK